MRMIIMKNILWYLGFLGLLSILYFVDGNLSYMGFAAFFLYFTFYSTNDERLKENAGKATSNAFLYVVIAGAVFLVYANISKNPEILSMAFAALFSGSIIVCVLSYFIYNILDEHT
jgi:hypothetical protein